MTTRRTKPPGCYVGKEDDFQRTAIALCRSIGDTQGVPREAVMHVPNGGQRNAIVGAKLKAQGTVPGYPDILVFHPENIRAMADREGWGDRKVGLAIELKVWPNKPSEAQLHIHEILRKAGWRVAVCYGLDQVTDVLNDYFGIAFMQGYERRDYEDQITRYRTLIQTLVNALDSTEDLDNGCPLPTWQKGYDEMCDMRSNALDAAKENGFIPNNV